MPEGITKDRVKKEFDNSANDHGKLPLDKILGVLNGCAFVVHDEMLEELIDEIKKAGQDSISFDDLLHYCVNHCQHPDGMSALPHKDHNYGVDHKKHHHHQ